MRIILVGVAVLALIQSSWNDARSATATFDQPHASVVDALDEAGPASILAGLNHLVGY